MSRFGNICKTILVLLAFLIYAGIVSRASATNHYVRAGATGANNGTDWENAWTNLPSTVAGYVRGDTYYIADGVYNGVRCRTDTIGTTPIWIKKATVEDHGTDVGWNDTYGDGTAEFNAPIYEIILTIETSYWIIDGQEEYGFKVYNPESIEKMKGISIANGSDNVSISHVEVQGAGSGLGIRLHDGIYVISPSSQNITVSHCYVHDWCRTWAYFLEANNIIIEHCIFEDCGSGVPEIHSEGIRFSSPGFNANIVVRHNIFKNLRRIGGSAYLGLGVDSDCSGFEIYGNTFIGTETWEGPGAAIFNSIGDTIDDVKIYNNNFIGLNKNASQMLFFNATNLYAYNNLYYNNLYENAVFFNGEIEHDYNWFYPPYNHGEAHGINGTGDPFVDSINENFRLKFAIEGIHLGSPYNTDMDGSVRGEDGVWDRGIYEYKQPPIITSVTISPNSGFAKIGDSVTITVTAGNNEAGLIPSDATINGKQVPLTDQDDGTYIGTYTVEEGDNDSPNIEATNITLTGVDGTSDPAFSSGSSLIVDGHTPTISAVELNPNSGIVRPGDNVTITVMADGNETGLISSTATFVNKSVPLYDQGNGMYTGMYTIVSSDSGAVFAGNSLFHDGFESGDTSNWSIVESGIAVGENSKLGSRGIEYNILSTDSRKLIKELGSDYSETYSSFYFKIDPTFIMADNDNIYISVMWDSENRVSWAAKLRKSGVNYQLGVYLGGWIAQIGGWVTISHNQWYWIKIHHNSDMNGSAEWWLNGVSQGVYSGDTSGALSGSFHGIYINGMSAGTAGKLYYDHFQVTTTDHSEPGILEATGITLTDAAGNVSEPASSSGSTLTVITEIQEIWGDVDNDMIVNIVDALKIATYDVDSQNDSLMSILTYVTQRGDVNADSFVNIIDALICASYEVNPDNFYLPPRIGNTIDSVPKFTTRLEIPADNSLSPVMLLKSSDSDFYSIETSVEVLKSDILIGAATVQVVWNSKNYHYLGIERMQENIVVNDKKSSDGMVCMAWFDVNGKKTLNFPIIHLQKINDSDSDWFSLETLAASEAVTFQPFSLDKRIMVSLSDANETPQEITLHQNIPNPFNSSTTIKYSVPHPSNITLDIYNVQGQKIRTLQSCFETAGIHTVVWDGTDNDSIPVSSGVYFYQLSILDYKTQKQMLLLR